MPQLKKQDCRHLRRQQRHWPATAKRFAEEGAYVFIAGRRKDQTDILRSATSTASTQIPPSPQNALLFALAYQGRGIPVSKRQLHD